MKKSETANDGETEYETEFFCLNGDSVTGRRERECYLSTVTGPRGCKETYVNTVIF